MEGTKPSYSKLPTIYPSNTSTGFICSFKHLSHVDYRSIYEPSEDSFLLIDALEADIDYIKSHINPSSILEVG